MMTSHVQRDEEYAQAFRIGPLFFLRLYAPREVLTLVLAVQIEDRQAVIDEGDRACDPVTFRMGRLREAHCSVPLTLSP
jgi:hypothetical protein